MNEHIEAFDGCAGCDICDECASVVGGLEAALNRLDRAIEFCEDENWTGLVSAKTLLSILKGESTEAGS